MLAISSRCKSIWLAVGIALYVAVGIVSIHWITGWMSQRYFDLLGEKALDISEMAVVHYVITDSEVEELRALEFREVLTHPANLRLNEIFAQSDFSEDFKYAYVLVHLEPEEIKYTVTPENARHFGVSAGTPLDLLWLVDAVVNKEQQQQVAGISSYYDDINRYSHLKKEVLSAYEERRADYMIVRDEYGDAFTGLVPLYSVEGSFVGMMGVDLYFEGFSDYVTMIRWYLTLLFLLPSILLTGAYLVIYVRKSRQSDRSANTDPLTCLYNRRYLEMALPQLIRSSAERHTPLAVIMIDIDNFKNYNDFYGHQAGDDALIAVSGAIRASVRLGDVVCRYGGEEMIVLLPCTDSVGATRVAQKIYEAIEMLKISHGHGSVANHLTVSQGIFTSIPHPEDARFAKDSVIKADIALYAAKEQGRDRYVLYDEETMATAFLDHLTP